MKMKNLILVALFIAISLLASVPMASAQVSEGDDVARIEQDITKFYQQYLSDRTSLQGLDSLAKSFLTDGMYDRLHRAGSFVDCDILIRAQDGSEMASQTVSCRHLDGEWYEASWKFLWSDSMTYVPLRVIRDKSSNKVKICYVVPEWGGREFGDDLLKFPSVRVKDDVDALTFVKTFYERYVGLYVTMPSSLSEDLEKMRREYCTQEVLRMFGQAREEMAVDAVFEYDLLIGNTDFDVFKSRSLRFQQQDAHTIMVCYDHVQVVVSVQKQKGKYRLTKVVCKNV